MRLGIQSYKSMRVKVSLWYSALKFKIIVWCMDVIKRELLHVVINIFTILLSMFLLPLECVNLWP